jgi:hypothetical protein
MNISYGTTENSREQIVSMLSARRQQGSYRVIDIGAQSDGWTKDVADMFVNINVEDSARTCHMDICDLTQWNKITEVYDYAICTHTLEDVYDPMVALRMLPKIARAGVITMPSYWAEISLVESQHWLGFIHHRWIFDQENKKMLVVPKLGIVGALHAPFKYDHSRSEICFEWENEIPYKVFMNNYLGPDPITVINEYKKLYDSR